MDLQSITDIQELKALKADQYDLKEGLETQYGQTKQNIVLINKRLVELQQENEKEKE